MDKLLEEYKEYYRTRMERYRDNPLFENTFLADKALYDAMNSCTELIQFKEKESGGKLSVNAAIALIKDKEKAWKQFFHKIKEYVRAKSSEQILDGIDAADIQIDMDLIDFVTTIEQKNLLVITADEYQSVFASDIEYLENIEVYENAEVVKEFRKETNEETPAEQYKRRKEAWQETLDNHRTYVPGWNIDYNLIATEDRHRRKMPYPDEVVNKRVVQHQKITGGN